MHEIGSARFRTTRDSDGCPATPRPSSSDVGFPASTAESSEQNALWISPPRAFDPSTSSYVSCAVLSPVHEVQAKRRRLGVWQDERISETCQLAGRGCTWQDHRPPFSQQQPSQWCKTWDGRRAHETHEWRKVQPCATPGPEIDPCHCSSPEE